MKKIIFTMMMVLLLSIGAVSAIATDSPFIDIKPKTFWTSLESFFDTRYELYTDKFSYEPGDEVKFTTAYIANQACSNAFIRVDIDCPQQNFNEGSSSSSVSNGEYVSAFIYFSIPSNIDGTCNIKSRLRCASNNADISDIDYQTISVESSVSCDEGYFGDKICQGSSIGDYYVAQYYMNSDCVQSIRQIEDCGNDNCENGVCISGKVSCVSLGGDVCVGDEVCTGSYYSTDTVNENNCCDIGCSSACQTEGQSCGSLTSGDCCVGLDCQNFQCVATGTCTSEDTKCGIVGDQDTSGDVYYTCVDGTFTSQGKVDGKCGYVSSDKKCANEIYGHCELPTYILTGKGYEEFKGILDCGLIKQCYGRAEGFECAQPFKPNTLGGFIGVGPIRIVAGDWMCGNSLTKQEFAEASEIEVEQAICEVDNHCKPRDEYKVDCVEPKKAGVKLSDSGAEYLIDLLGWLSDTGDEGVCLATEENGGGGDIMGLLGECIYTLPSGSCLTILHAIIGLFGLVLIVNMGKK